MADELITKILDLVFPSRRPIASIDHPRLGQLLWSHDEGGWTGQVAGIHFEIARASGAHPDPRLIEYAENVLLTDPGWLSSELEAAKTQFLQECRNQSEEMAAFYTPELDTLRYEVVHFRLRNRTPALFAHLGEVRDDVAPDRLWHIQFVERSCWGLGFDT